MDLFSAGIRQMSAPSRRPSSSIDQESVEKCEVVHTSKNFSPDRGPGERHCLVFEHPWQKALTAMGAEGSGIDGGPPRGA
jgi:hypothetical protein